MADYYSAWIEADNESDALAKGIEHWDADLGDFHHFDVDCWIDIVERFAAQAIAADVQHAAPSSRKALAGTAEDSRRYALYNGYATLRKDDNAQNHIADDASLCICASASAAFVVQFTSRADFRTTVYAQDAIEAEAVGQYLWDSHGQYSDAFDKIEDVTGWSARSA